MLIEDLSEKLSLEGLQIGSNNYNDIFHLYQTNIEFAKLSHAYPVEMDEVMDDVEMIPPFTDENHKHFLSIYNGEKELVAVLDLIEDFSYGNHQNTDCIWVGLLQINGGKHKKGLGSSIIHSLFQTCKDNNKKTIQLGVIPENESAIKFWGKMGFQAFTEVNNGELDLILMEKQIEVPAL